MLKNPLISSISHKKEIFENSPPLCYSCSVSRIYGLACSNLEIISTNPSHSEIGVFEVFYLCFVDNIEQSAIC